jgi:ribulose-bisphosphate carboxylase large chain
VSVERIVATYLVETPGSLEQVAEVIAGEQSSGTFVELIAETPELRARHRATVERVTELETSSSPALLGRYPAGATFRSGEITISWPLENIGTSLINVLPAVLGNLTELIQVSGLRLLNLQLPRSLMQNCPLPGFSVEGTRGIAGVEGRPIIGTIVKPSVGLSPEQTAELVFELALAGVDFVKDDELIASPPYSPLGERLARVETAVERAADITGRKIMVAYNITGELDEMRRRHDQVRQAGGSCVMVCLNAVGLAGLMALSRDGALPIHGHRAGWGALTRHPMLGIDFAVYQTLWRLAGADHIHVNGLDSKFWESNESVARSARMCLEPLLDSGDRAMPVLSSGQWGGQAPETYRLVGSLDVLYLAGGGIIAHPLGPAAGVKAIHDAWTAASAGVDLAEYAVGRPELAASLTTFGRGS